MGGVNIRDIVYRLNGVNIRGRVYRRGGVNRRGDVYNRQSGAYIPGSPTVSFNSRGANIKYEGVS